MFKTLVCILLSLAAFTQAQQQAIGLSSNASAVATCKSSCAWSDPNTWDLGVIPGPGYAVTIQNTDTLNLVIDIPVTVDSFITSSTNKILANIVIIPGGSLTVTGAGQTTIAWTTTLTIQAGANYTVIGSGAVVNQGIIIVEGNFTTTAGTPSLTLDTANTQRPDITETVYANLTLAGGYVIAVGGITVGSTSNLVGSGYIIGSIRSSGSIYFGTTTTPGTLYVYGDVDLSLQGVLGSSQLFVKVASASSFDHLIMTGTFTQAGALKVSAINNYTPLNFQKFYFANHTAQYNGFASVRGDGLIARFTTAWRVQVDQTYTALVYGSASTVAISSLMLVVCALLTVL